MNILRKLHLQPDYIRSTIFGIEDALVSTTGVIAGVSAGAHQKEFVILAALVTVAVEALSMGAGQYLSEEAVHEMSKEKHTDNLITGALFMFGGYLFAGLIPVIPILLFPTEYAYKISIASAFVGLFALGYIKGKIVKVPALKSAFKILFVGGLATIIGAIVGLTLQIG
jgi:VIT1/CCC1 family predicted Fe2+/Mn2+ transporter